MNRLKQAMHRLDEFQQRRRWLAIPVAVVRKFADDEAGNQAALLAYYGFFSLFPLLLVFVTGVSFVLAGHPALQDKLVNSALADFPVIGAQLHAGLHGVK